MDIELEERVREALNNLSTITDVGFYESGMDPIARMMLVTMLHEAQKIRDTIDSVPQRVLERFSTHFIPAEKWEAMPAITLVNPQPQKDMEIVTIDASASFTFKDPERKMPLTYIPIFETKLLPQERTIVIPQYRMAREDHVEATEDEENTLWLGIVTKAEVETLKGVSIMIKGARGVVPERITVGPDGKELEFASFWQMHQLKMLHPFDSQQASPKMFDMLEMWKREMLNLDVENMEVTDKKEVTLLYITDVVNNRDLFKPKRMPYGFKMSGKTVNLDPNTLWLGLQFPKGFHVPEECEVTINVVPVTNVEVNSLTLKETQPMAKLVKQDDDFFLDILETTSTARKMGHDAVGKEVLVRDFESACYNNEDLFRDVRNLYNRFVEDYFAFIDYNKVNNGEVIKQLREIIKELGKSVLKEGSDTGKVLGTKDEKGKKLFSCGTYVMKNINNQQVASNIKVKYITTQGAAGNLPEPSDKMEARKIPGVNKEALVLVKARGGADKATPDNQYEMLRYFTLTADRLFTKMDLDAFLRKEIMLKFGKSEFDRILVKINVQGTGAMTNVKRALYIDLEFKDKKNYDKAVKAGFRKYLQQNIDARSCLNMPVFISFENLEKQS